MPKVPHVLPSICEQRAFGLIVAIRDSPTGSVPHTEAERRFGSRAIRTLLRYHVCTSVGDSLTLNDAALRAAVYDTIRFNPMVGESR